MLGINSPLDYKKKKKEKRKMFWAWLLKIRGLSWGDTAKTKIDKWILNRMK